jgi:hypothetical protein
VFILGISQRLQGGRGEQLRGSGKRVVVAGGGPAGFGAALAAARAGATVTLVEQHSFIGGNMVIGLCLHTFHNRSGDRVIEGIPAEFIGRLMDLGASVGPVPIPGGHMYSTTPVDHEWVKEVALQMLVEAGVRVRFNTQILGVQNDGGRLRSLLVCDKSGLGAFEAEIFVDATGDADLAARAGVPYDIGRKKDGLVQPSSLLFKAGGVDLDRFMASPGGLHCGRARLPGSGKEEVVWFAATTTPWNEVIEKKGYFIGKDREWWGNSIRKGEANVNASRLHKHDSTNPEQNARAMVEGRAQVREMMEFLTQNCPGWEGAYLISVAPFVGVRESRRTVGEYVLTGDDVRSGRHFPDVIAQLGYPLDTHSPTGTSIAFEQIGGRGTYEVPFRCLLPKNVDNLLMAGRCISMTHEAHAAVRVMIQCMAIGQAAGVGAALAAQERLSPKELDIKQVQEILLAQKAKLSV